MGNKKNESTKSLDNLKKEFQILTDDQMKELDGGKKSSTGWNIGPGGPTPQ